MNSRSRKNVIRSEAKKLFEEVGDSIDFKVGTMIEIPRAALTATVLLLLPSSSHSVQMT